MINIHFPKFYLFNFLGRKIYGWLNTLKLNIFTTTKWFEMTTMWKRMKTYNKAPVKIFFYRSHPAVL